MGKVNRQAAVLMEEWIRKNGTENRKALLDYAYSLVNHYAEASSALACQMYEATAMAQGAVIRAAEATEELSYGEIAKAINGTLKRSEKMVPSTVGRLVKQAGADTTLKNAERDGAQFAWVPHGDTCAFCIMLASRGWQFMSKNAMRNGHAEHIHANCDCQYAIRFDNKSTIEGYDPKKYLDIYKNAEGHSSTEKLKSIRKMVGEDNGEIKKDGYIDITRRLLKNARPGSGKLEFEKGTAEADRKIADWIHKTFGGNIICLEERSGEGKRPDALWDGTYWEFKAPTTKNAINDRIRKAQKQLYETLEREGKADSLRGMIIDISENSMGREEAVEEIINRTRTRCKGKTEVIVYDNGEMVAAFRVE